MLRLLLFFLFFNCSHSFAQKGFLFVKKNGKKVRTFTEGSVLHFQTKHRGEKEGYISFLKNDSIFVGGTGFHKSEIERIILRPSKTLSFPVTKELLALTLGVGLSTAGMTLNHWEPFNKALVYSSVIGYSPILIAGIKNKISFTRKKYVIGKKFRIQVLDFYF